MAETLRDLVVSLSLQSNDFSKNIAMVNKQIQEAQSKFALASAGVRGFEKTTSGLGAKLTMLKTKQDLQNKVVDQYRKGINEADKKLQRLTDTHGKLNKELDAAKKKEADLKEQLRAMKEAYKEEAEAAEGDAAAAALLSEKIAELEKEHKEAQGEVSNLEKKLSTSSKSMRNTANNISDMSAKLNNAETEMKQITREIGDTSDALKKMESLWGRAESALQAYAKSANKVGDATDKVGRKLTRNVTAPIVAMGAYALKAEIDFESAFAGVRKTVDATETEYAELEEAIKNMALEIPSATDDLAGVMEIAGQLGILKENLAEYTRTIVDLDNTTNLSAEEGASQIAQFANVTGMAQGEVRNFGSAIVALGNNFATTESDILNMATRLGAAGTQIGLSEAQILGFATALSSVGLEAEAGGTAFSKAMIKMQVAVETGNESLAEFARVSGMTVEAFTSLWNSNPAAAVESFIVGLSDMNEEGISSIVTLQELGFKEVRLRDTLLRASNASELFARAQGMANTAWEENTALADEAAVRYETMQSQLQILKNRVTIAAQSLGSEMAPMAREVVARVSEMIDRFMALDTSQKEQIIKWAAVAAAVGPALSAFGKIVSISGKVSNAAIVIGRAIGSMNPTVLGIGAATAGIAALVAGMNALYDTTPKYQKAMDALFSSVDSKKLDSFNRAYEMTLTADVKVEPGSVEVESLYGDIEKALTDGLPDTPEVIAELEAKDRSFYSTQVDSINGWVKDEISKLDASSETYDQDVENIKAKGAEMIAELEKQQEATVEFIASASGKSTEAVKARLGELDAIESRALEVTAEINEATKAAKSEGEQASNVVKSGVSMNEETAGRAFAYARKTYEDETGALKAQFEIDLKELEALGAEAYAAGIGDLEEAYAAQEDAVLAAYQNELSDLLNGLGEALATAQPELAEKMRETAEALDLQQETQAVIDGFDKGISEGYRFEASELSQKLANALGFGDSESLAQELNAMLDGTSVGGKINLTQFMESLEATIAEGIGGTEESDFGGLSEIFQGLIEKGVTAGIDGIDLESNEGKLLALFTDVGAEAPEGIKKGIAENASAATGEAETLAKNTKIAADSQTGEYYGIGEDVALGMANGINAKRGYVVSAAKNLARAVEEATRVRLDTHSPSRIAEEIGEDWGDGLAGGMTNRRTLEAVKKASRYLAGTMTTTTREEVGKGTTDARDQSVNVTIENYNASSEQDVDALARSISSMTKRRNRGYGTN